MVSALRELSLNPSVLQWEIPVVLRSLSCEQLEPIEKISLKLFSLKIVLLLPRTSMKQVSDVSDLRCKPPIYSIPQNIR